MNTRMSYEIKMTTERLQQMIFAANSASKAMTEGQVLRIEVSHNVDFVFYNLKPFQVSTGATKESESPKE